MAGTLTVTITSVNPAQSVLFFETRHNSDRPVGSMVRGRLATATTLEFTRVTNDTNPVPITIRWYVAHFSSGVSVQRGETDQSATVIDVPISAVGAVDHAFVTWSKTPLDNHTNNFDGDDPTIGELTSTTNLRFRVTTARSGMTISWQVVEFTNAPDVRVQKGSTALTGGALSVDVTLAPADAVNVSSTFVLVGYNVDTNPPGNMMGTRMLRAQLIDPTTIRIDRNIGGGNNDITEIHWQAVELRDGSAGAWRQREPRGRCRPDGRGPRRNGQPEPGGGVRFGAADGGASMGRTAYTGGDIPGVCSVHSWLLRLLRSRWSATNTAEHLRRGLVRRALRADARSRPSRSPPSPRLPAISEVRLHWETGAELNNLGFHLYRGTPAPVRGQRITPALVLGLGPLPTARSYSYRDRELVNGSTYYYLLEDIETTGRTRRHGPVSATPLAGAAPAALADRRTAASPLGPRAPERWLRFGTPEATRSLSWIARQDDRHAVDRAPVTGGFYALPDGKGGVWLSIPGFEETRTPGAPALPGEARVDRGRRREEGPRSSRCWAGHGLAFGPACALAVTGEPELKAGRRRHR